MICIAFAQHVIWEGETMAAQDGKNTRQRYLLASLIVLLVAMGLTISSTLAASNGPPVVKGTTASFDPSGGATLTPTPCNVQTFIGSLTTSAPTQPGRVTRDSASSCGESVVCPGINDANPRHYDAYTFTNQ